MVVSSIPAFSIIAFASDSDIQVENKNEVYGFVTLDPIVYIHGTLASGAISSTGDDELRNYDYMTYGSIISDGDYTGECSTAVSISGKTLSSVVATDTNSTLSVSGGKLTGDLGGGYGSVKEYADKSTVTLIFTFTDGTYEIHKLAVKPNPVPTHSIANAFAWWSRGNKIRNTAIQVLAQNSYGATSGSSYDTHFEKNSSQKQYGEALNNPKLFAPYSNSTTSGLFFAEGSIKSNQLVQNNDSYKITGQYGSVYNGNGDGTRVKVISTVANYYVDLSSNNNYGMAKDSNGKYHIDLQVGNVYNNTTKCTEQGKITDSTDSFMTNGLSISSGDTPSVTDNTIDDNGFSAQGSFGTAYYNDIVLTWDNLAQTTEGYYDVTYAHNKNDKNVSAMVRTNFKITVSDKTEARDYFNQQYNDLKNSDLYALDYTSDSWSNYKSALLELEYYLNDNTQTDLSTYLSAVKEARANLVESSYGKLHKYLTGSSAVENEVNNNSAKYYSESVNKVNALISLAKELLSNPIADSASYLTLFEKLCNYSNYLVPITETAELESAITSNNVSSIFENSVQVIPLSNWNELNTKLTDAKTVLNENKDKPKYDTTEETFDVNSSEYGLLNYDSNSNSVYQNLIDTTASSLNGYTVESIDGQNLASAFALFHALDTDKLTDDALALYNAIDDQFYNGNINSLIGEKYAGYKDVIGYANDDMVAEYNKATNSSYDCKIVYNNQDVTDGITKLVLDFVSNANMDSEGYVNTYNVYFKDVNDAQPQSTGSFAYGSNVEFSSTGDSVTWEVNLYSKGDAQKAVNGEEVSPVKTYKLSSAYGNSIDRVITYDMIVTAVVTDSAPSSAQYKVNVYNGYGSLQNVYYYSDSDSDAIVINDAKLTINGEEVKVLEYPFYTLTSWERQNSDDGRTITLKPVYETNTDKIKITTEAGTTVKGLDENGYAKTNSTITLVSSDENFYAWARLVDGKYQIMSYNKEFLHIVFKASDFYVVSKSDGKYMVNGVELTEANIADFNNYSSTVSLTSYLDSKAPFTHIDATESCTLSTGAAGTRYYVSVTDGSSYKSFGVIIKTNGAEKFVRMYNMGKTNQYYASGSNSYDGVAFYVTSTVNYNGNSIDIRMVSDYNN